MDFNIYIYELNGYLKAIQRLCGRAYVFGANYFPAKSTIDEDINKFINKWDRKNKLTYVEKVDIGYNELMKDMESIIFDGFLNRDRLKSEGEYMYLSKTIFEDIQEYYGLISTAINSHGIFHPLIKIPKYKIKILSDDFDKSLFFLFQIEHIFLLTFFYKKCKNSFGAK